MISIAARCFLFVTLMLSALGCTHTPQAAETESAISLMGTDQPTADVLKSLEACIANNAEGCIVASKAYATGDGAPFNLKRAYKLLDLPCNKGDARSCYRRGFLEVIAEATAASEANATPFYRKACAADSKYCAQLGQHLQRKGEKSEEARLLLKKACDAGSARGCRALAFEFLWDAPLAESPPEFETLSHRTCVLLGKSESECREIMNSCLQKSDDFKACGQFPRLRGIASGARPKVTSHALALSKCTEEKLGDWCYSLGAEVNDSKPRNALFLFELGCRNGSALACSSMVDSFRKGRGVRRSEELAKLSERRMCALNEGADCYLEVFSALNLLGIKAQGGNTNAVLSRVGCAAFNHFSCKNSNTNDLHLQDKALRNNCVMGDNIACEALAKKFNKNANQAAELIFAGKRCQNYAGTDGCIRAAELSWLSGNFQQSKRFFKRGCSTYATKTCVQFARMLDNDDFNEKTPFLLRRHLSQKRFAVPLEYYIDACKREQGTACENLGYAYLYGEGLPIDPKKGMQALEAACAVEPSYCGLAVNEYYTGRFIEGKKSAAVEFARKTCRDEDTLCELDAKFTFQKDKSEENRMAYARALEKHAKLGYVAPLAAELVRGAVMEQDIERAKKLLGPECAIKGNVGCAALGEYYLSESSSAEDKLTAKQYITTACYAHVPEACETWKSRLEDATFASSKHELKEVFSRGCLERIPGYCEEYERRFAASDEYAAKAKAQLTQSGEIVERCSRQGVKATALVYFEVDERAVVSVERDHVLTTEGPTSFGECVAREVEGLKFDPAPASAQIVWEVKSRR